MSVCLNFPAHSARRFRPVRMHPCRTNVQRRSGRCTSVWRIGGKLRSFLLLFPDIHSAPLRCCHNIALESCSRCKRMNLQKIHAMGSVSCRRRNIETRERVFGLGEVRQVGQRTRYFPADGAGLVRSCNAIRRWPNEGPLSASRGNHSPSRVSQPSCRAASRRRHSPSSCAYRE
jgi:hypothetical protein